MHPLALILSLFAASAAQATLDPDLVLENQRSAFVDAQNLISEDRLADYRAVRERLDDYPLAIYLDLMALEAQLSEVDGERARNFVEVADDTPLALRFKDRYLRSTGKRRQWESFLAVSPDAPRSVELRCYYYRAQNQAGEKTLAWEGARELWLHGKSRPKACDTLFEEWKRHRSSRLNQQYRVIYRVNGEQLIVLVVEVTPHDYRRKS